VKTLPLIQEEGNLTTTIETLRVRSELVFSSHPAKLNFPAQQATQNGKTHIIKLSKAIVAKQPRVFLCAQEATKIR